MPRFFILPVWVRLFCGGFDRAAQREADLRKRRVGERVMRQILRDLCDRFADKVFAEQLLRHRQILIILNAVAHRLKTLA